jgi:hypothetical protein
VLGTRGRALLGDAIAQWNAAMSLLLDETEFDTAVQEAVLMLLLQARGMVEVRDLIKEAAEVLSSSGWRDTGNGAPPDERDVSRAVWAVLRRCSLWSMVDEGRGSRLHHPGAPVRRRHPGCSRRLRQLALRPRFESD